MKNSKTFIIVLAVVLSAFFANAGFSQTKEESHAKLSEHHNKAVKAAGDIVSDKAKTKEEKVAKANEATASLKEAKKEHENLKKAIPEHQKAMAKPYHDKIDKHHAAATKHAEEMNKELKKPAPNHAKVKEHAKGMKESIEKAENEHKAMKTKIK
ncbi:hypothetical protein ACM55I_11065 [Flavobacterium sp. GB2R13]|uniref:hypothetical protein n=1 Tax=Flavobacterium algoris TaxID=3398733 RepID=UPI003A851E86